MKNKMICYCLGVALGLLAGSQFASAQSTAFTYQGKLEESGQPVTGLYEMRFALHDSANSVTPLPGASASLVTGITNGLFTVWLDFGSTYFDGSPRWMQISVRTNGSTSTPVPLLPRTLLGSSPHASYAKKAGSVANGAITGAHLASGSVGPSQLAPGSVVRSLNGLKDDVVLAPGNNITITPNGNTLTVSSTGGGVFSLAGTSAYYNGGNVGIGTATPSSTLEVDGDIGASGDLLVGKTLRTRTAATEAELGEFIVGNISRFIPPASYTTLPPRLAVKQNGSVGLGISNPSEKLHVNGKFLRVEGSGGEAAYLGGDGVGGEVHLGSLNPNVSKVAVYNQSSGRYMHVYVGAITILGGADLAEPFQMSSPEIPEGSVVVIDEENAGRLKLSTQAYDTRVAGIVSGANGINPGMTLSQQGVLEGGQQVALTGRVYVKADASLGAIKPGDLLTTSETPGHAMKVIESTRAQGAILGKAMTALDEGTGLVLVLVTLQ